MGAEIPDMENIHFAYGHAVGAGVQELFISGSLDKAKFAAFLAWKMDILSGLKETPGSSHEKSFPRALEALNKFYGHYLVLAGQWELFKYLDENQDECYAIELSAKVEFPNSFVYRIFIDLVLRNKGTGELLVFELKTDGMKYAQPEKYANSNQALSYSVILDKIAPGSTSFFVWYAVYYTKLERWEFFQYSKSRLDKANWIRTVIFETGHIKEYLEAGFFPKHGESCVDWGRVCQHFGTCGMSNRSVYAPEVLRDLRVAKELEQKYTYSFTLEEIIDQQLKDIQQ